MKKTFVNEKYYPHIRYTEDKAMIANPDESSFILIQNQKISETIFKKLLNDEGYKIINKCANNYKLLKEDKSTNTDPIIKNVVNTQESFNEIKKQNILLLAEIAKKDRIIDFLKQKINNQ